MGRAKVSEGGGSAPSQNSRQPPALPKPYYEQTPAFFRHAVFCEAEAVAVQRLTHLRRALQPACVLAG